MRFEARIGAAAVRYASVDPGSGGRGIHGRGTDGEGGSGYADRSARLLALTCDFRPVARCHRLSLPVSA
jgi:hypothetical protein